MRILLLSLLGLVLSVATPTFALTTNPADGLSELTVPIDQPSTFLEKSRKTLDTLLAEIPEPKTKVQSAVAKTGQFLLWGDLFQTGDRFALLELASQSEDSEDGGVAFAEWQDGAWRLRQIWKVRTTWRPAGWKNSVENDDYLPAIPATQPFELRNLGGGKTPDVVVAGGVWRYFQENYLFHFSRKTKTLIPIARAMGSPEVANKYVVLYFNSGHLSVWEEWQFYRWEGERLILVASWHDEVGYNDHDPTFTEGKRIDASGNPAVIRIRYGNGLGPMDDAYELTKNGKPFGRMRVTWKNKKDQSRSDADTIEKACLFEKVTGLSRQLYPRQAPAKPIPKLKDFATITIEGNPEAAKLFKTSH